MTNGRDTARPGMTPPAKLVATLGGLGAAAGLLIFLVFAATEPTIQAHRAAVLAEAVMDVLGEPERYDTLYLVDGGLSEEPPAGVAPERAEAVYLGYRDGAPVGFAIRAASSGFQDTITLLFGYDPSTSQLLGMTILESKETPGLGDKIYKDLEFVAEFEGVTPPLLGVKEGSEKGAPGEIVMITGATISSRAVIKAINTELERIGPVLTGYGRRPHP
ncbi:MAG TPA: FMN-binding protein [Vicinamibacterales bacterium]|nr:FMN-binding protein [Vicinamibacterales bacterium]